MTTGQSQGWLSLLKSRFKKALGRASIEEEYDVGDKLGEGAFSTVRLGVSKTNGDPHAIKIYNTAAMRPCDKNRLHKEVEVMGFLSHPNIVSLNHTLVAPTQTYLVMEYLRGGELLKRLLSKKRFTEQEARECMRGVFSAVAHMHARGIVHRDLKLENMLFASEEEGSPLKITDFGFATRVIPNQPLRTPCGTVAYVAPEVVSGRGYDKSVDCWSLGVILYMLVCGVMPFYGDTEKQILSMVRKGKFDFPSSLRLSDECKALITALLTYDPRRRISAADALEHPWFQMTEGITAPAEEDSV